MKSIKYCLFAFAFIAVMGICSPLQAKTHISFNLSGFFPLFAPPARTVVVQQQPCAPCYEEIHIYPSPYGYTEHRIHRTSPVKRIYHYPTYHHTHIHCHRCCGY